MGTTSTRRAGSAIELAIHPELEDYLPALESEEIQQLRRNLERDGCLDPVLYWSGDGGHWIVDGANRWSLCSDLGIGFETREMKFSSIDQVKLWMIEHQQGRRNLTNFQIETLRQKCRKDAEASARKKSDSDSVK